MHSSSTTSIGLFEFVKINQGALEEKNYASFPDHCDGTFTTSKSDDTSLVETIQGISGLDCFFKDGRAKVHALRINAQGVLSYQISEVDSRGNLLAEGHCVLQ